MKWKKGRQGSGYLVHTVCNFGFFDIQLIKIPEGIEVPVHKDPIPNKRHYRLNIDLVKPEFGGRYVGKSIFKLPRIHLIRSDRDYHAISEVIKGQAVILSIGVAIAE